MELKRTEREIDQVLDKMAEYTSNGRTKYAGSTYEQGVDAAIRWIMGWEDDNPAEGY